MSDRFRATVTRLAPFLALLLFAAAVVVLRGELAGARYARIIGHLHSLSWGTLAKALGLTLLGYGVLTRYDALGMRYVHRRVPASRTALASFIAYSLSQTLGFAIFTGGAVRYRFWSSWGLSTSEIARAMGFAGLTLWLGVVTLAGAAMVADPETLAGLTRLGPGALRVTGVTLLGGVLAYLGVTLLRRRPVQVFGWRFEVPTPALAFEQLVVSCLDWGLAALVLYVLLPPAAGLTFPAFVGAFVVAQVAGLASHLPGGVGVFDTLIVLELRPFADPGAVFGALVAFRVLYYLVPFLLGVLLLGISEALRQRAYLQRAARWAGRWLPGLLPWALAAATFAGGVVLLLSGATPGVPSRLRWLGEILPLSVIEASHFIGSMAGMGLIILAWALSRRLDAAYYLALILLGVGIGASLLKGADYEEAILLAGIMGLLVPARRRFYRRATLLAEPLSTEWVVSVLAVLIAVVALAQFRYRHLQYSDQLWWRFALHADASRFLRATVGALGVLAGFGLLRLFRPSQPEPALPGPEELGRVEGVLRTTGPPPANLALMGDKAILWSESGAGFLSYGISGRCWVAMGDPVGPPADRAELVWAFRALTHRHAGWTVFYEVGREYLPLYIDLGLTLAKLGEDARIPLGGFSLDGSSRRALRRTCRQVERAGATFEMVPREAVPGLMPELEGISDDWLRTRRTREKGFSLGGFDPVYLGRFRLGVVRHCGRVVAFANVWDSADRAEASADLMRYRADAPDGVMHFLLVNLFLQARGEGYRWFSIGMAPLSGFERRSLAPLWHRVGSLVYEHGERFYNFRGLRRFKEKFDPVWEPRYLASPGGLALPRILASVAALISDGWRGVVAK
ncbi:MAG TPA: bifunctional lysylphosphatidylglycerol flippase/synthetase MprF [Gemmatimonadales bacterium]|jgi:phosphatidylglycerol lysyltransferase|nr:bifunctional lysylphosphatidylglycerol flippase/synthetase MprF [Gemmatimonadales bacterium]